MSRNTVGKGGRGGRGGGVRKQIHVKRFGAPLPPKPFDVTFFPDPSPKPSFTRNLEPFSTCPLFLTVLRAAWFYSGYTFIRQSGGFQKIPGFYAKVSLGSDVDSRLPDSGLDSLGDDSKKMSVHSSLLLDSGYSHTRESTFFLRNFTLYVKMDSERRHWTSFPRAPCLWQSLSVTVSPEEYRIWEMTSAHFPYLVQSWVRQWMHVCVSYGGCLDEIPTFSNVKVNLGS